MKHLIISFLCITFLCMCKPGQSDHAANAKSLPDSTAIQTARQAYLFGLPLVVMDITRRQFTDKSNPVGVAENVFRNLSSFPDASFRNVVRPNADTYYSTAMLNLEKEPLVLTVPDTKDRYYMMPMLDAYTNVFSSPGKRTTGTGAGSFLITGPQWSGDVPAGMTQIKSPTDMVWIIGRTQVNSKIDGDQVVVPIQKQYKLTPLSAYGKAYTPPAPNADPNTPKGDPNSVLKNMRIDSFFNYVNRLMLKNPPAADDKPAMDKFETIGVKPGGKFDLSTFSADAQEVIKNIPQETLDQLQKTMNTPRKPINGWDTHLGKTGKYGTDYEMRALIAYGGLGANLSEDAVYPSCAVDADGNKLTGQNKYVLHFDKGQTPPAKAFWSLTMYDPDGYMVKNPINRNVIGDRSNLKANADGSVDIYIQNTSPGKDKESNWLPAPTGDFNVLMRIYWPKEEMLNGQWSPPPVKKV